MSGSAKLNANPPDLLLQLLGMVVEAAEKLSPAGAGLASNARANPEYLLKHLIDRSFPLSLESMQRIRAKIRAGGEEGARLRDDWVKYLQILKNQQLKMTDVATAAAREVIGELSLADSSPSSMALLQRWVAAFERHHACLAQDAQFAADYAELFGLAIRLTRRYPEPGHA